MLGGFDRQFLTTRKIVFEKIGRVHLNMGPYESLSETCTARAAAQGQKNPKIILTKNRFLCLRDDICVSFMLN
jgi:hypothetical protein